MTNYSLYAESCGLQQKDLVDVIHREFPFFTKIQMSLASNPSRNALQLIPDAEELLVKEYGAGPGLSISPKFGRSKSHGNKNKPNRLCVRLDNSLRSRVQAVYERMCFATMQDFLEAAIAAFVEKYEVR